jgi:hypothetical protein
MAVPVRLSSQEKGGDHAASSVLREEVTSGSCFHDGVADVDVELSIRERAIFFVWR